MKLLDLAILTVALWLVLAINNCTGVFETMYIRHVMPLMQTEQEKEIEWIINNGCRP